MKLATVSGVELFAAGTRRGKTYTPADLDNMVRQFGDTKHLVSPPVVIGHEEDQSWTGIPKHGRVSRLWTALGVCAACHGNGTAQGQTCSDCAGLGKTHILKADFDQVPEPIANLINNRAYDKVSAEIYDEPPEGVPGSGRMLRRVALLGGELPQIKSLEDIPQAKFSDYHSLKGNTAALRVADFRHGGGGVWECFFEISPKGGDDMTDYELTENDTYLTALAGALGKLASTVGRFEEALGTKFASLAAQPAAVTSAISIANECDSKLREVMMRLGVSAKTSAWVNRTRDGTPENTLTFSEPSNPAEAERFWAENAGDLETCGFTKAEFVGAYKQAG